MTGPEIPNINLTMTAEEAAQAACKGQDPEIFFIGRGEMWKIPIAQAICESCPVREPCLEEAIEIRDVTFRGGFGERAQRRIRTLGWTAAEAIAKEDYFRGKRGRPKLQRIV